MADTFRITLAQLNPTVGDLPGNAAKVREAWEQAREAGSAMLVLPEMFITGYQTQDLVLKAAFTQDGMAEIEESGGGRTLARGEAAVNDMVFFRDQVIEGPAPDLPVEAIEV